MGTYTGRQRGRKRSEAVYERQRFLHLGVSRRLPWLRSVSSHGGAPLTSLPPPPRVHAPQLKEAREAHNLVLEEMDDAALRADLAAAAAAAPLYEPEYAQEGYEGPPPARLKASAADLAKVFFGRPLWGNGGSLGGAVAGAVKCGAAKLEEHERAAPPPAAAAAQQQAAQQMVA